METLLSVIIPHYNTPDSLDRLLAGIIPEKESNTEILVIDDHSTTVEELKAVTGRYPQVRFLSNDPDKKGAGSSRNAGLANAKGKWLLFADADDVFLEGWHDIVSEYFDQESDIIYFCPTGKGKNERVGKKYGNLVTNYLEESSETNEDRLRYSFVVPWSKMIRRSIVEKNGIWFDDIPYGNDMLFSAQCGFFAKRIRADKRMIYCSVGHPGSLTTRKTAEVLIKRTEVQCRLYQYVRNKIGPARAKKLTCAYAIYFCIQEIRNNHYGSRCFRDSIKLFIKYRIPLTPSMKRFLKDMAVKVSGRKPA